MGYSQRGCRELDTTELLNNNNKVGHSFSSKDQVSFNFMAAVTISSEIKRHLLLGRKAMTNLDSILKSRDITLPKKGLYSQSYGLPVVMYGCESWTIKKAEH